MSLLGLDHPRQWSRPGTDREARLTTLLPGAQPTTDRKGLPGRRTGAAVNTRHGGYFVASLGLAGSVPDEDERHRWLLGRDLAVLRALNSPT